MLGMLLGLAIIGQQFSAPQAKTELVPSQSAIVPGKPFSVALHMTMAPGWHNYYINPGESGQATSIDWTLPKGFRAGPIQWPVPERIVVGGVAGYVYENQAWLVTKITPSKSLKPGDTVSLSAVAKWLLCREACVPQESKLVLTLPVSDTSVPNTQFGPAMSVQVRADVPAGLIVRTKGKAAVLSLPAGTTKGAVFFPADAMYFGADLASEKSTASGINLTIPLSKYAPGPPKRLSGILVLSNGSARDAHWIDVKVMEP